MGRTMKLDRYDTGIPKFRVFRHVEEGNPIPSGTQVRTIRDEDGRAWAEVDPLECFVLKRRDLIGRFMVAFGSLAAALLGDREYSEDLMRLSGDWDERTTELGDSKMPD